MSYLSRLAFGPIRTLVLVGLFATGLVPRTAGPVFATPSAATSKTTSFQGLGEMPGVPSGAGFGTYASGISGDGSTIVGYGQLCTTFAADGSCSSSSTVQAYRWTVAGGYQLLGGPGGTDFFGNGTVSYDGSVVVGENPQPNAYAAFRWTAAQGMMSLPMNI